MGIPSESLNLLDILRSIPDSVLTIDREKQLVALNKPAQALTRREESAAAGRPCGEVLRSEICGTTRCPFEQAFAGKETVTNFNVTMRNSTGAEIPICINTSPLKNAHGEIIGVVETIRDVSHINRLIAELRDQRNKVQAVLDSIAEGVLTVNQAGIITSCSRTAGRILDRPVNDILERPFTTLFPQNPTGPESPLTETLRTGRYIRDREVTLTDRQGNPIPVSLSTGPFRDEAGTLLGAVCTVRDLREIERIAEERRTRSPFVGIVGKHPKIREVFDLVEMIKDSDSTVLLHGESGSGKGLFARALHDLSQRRAFPFVKVSCAALPETLLESELFGHEKGAFTGAIKERKGRFELADKGTIFLDEIGDLSPTVQVKLLRVLQDQEFERLGGNQTIRVDARVIAATHRNLPHLMREGKFREDLFYRLNVIPIHIPPLRERKSDIPLLVEYLLDRFAARGKGKATSLSPRTMSLLMDHPWPGNVRELENVLEHAMVCCKGAVIESEAMPHSLLLGRPEPGGKSLRPPARDRQPTPRALSEKETILRSLESSRWNRGLAAARLGIDRTTLWRKMRRLGVTGPGR